MNVVMWAVVGLAVLVFLISVSVTCSVFAKTFETEMLFDDITHALMLILSIAASATFFAVLMINMLERGGA